MADPRPWFRATHVVFSGAALALGLALGAIPGRAHDAVAVADAAERQEKCAPQGMDVARFFEGRPFPTGAPAAPAPEPAVADGGDGVQIQVGDAPEAPVDREAQLAVVRDGMALRTRQARAALTENAAPTPEQEQSIDEAVDAMNEDLQALAKEFATEFAGKEPSRRDLMVFASDSLDVLITAEDGIYGALSPEQRAELDEASLDPLSYVDPAIVDTLATLEVGE